MAVMIAPRMSTYRPDFHLLSPIRAALAKPKLKSSTMPMQMTAISCWSVCLRIPAEMMQGKAGSAPKMTKATKVTTPHFLATISSSTTIPSSQSIIMFTKAWELVAQRSAILLESSRVKFFFRQISMIYFFSSFKRFYTSQNSRAYSDLMYCISARAERQSPSPIPIASPIIAHTHSVKILQAYVLEDTPLRMMRRVLRVPSMPPQTIDFRYSPASMWASSCSFADSRGFSEVIWSDIKQNNEIEYILLKLRQNQEARKCIAKISSNIIHQQINQQEMTQLSAKSQNIEDHLSGWL